MIFCSPALVLSIEKLQNTGTGRKPFLVFFSSCLNFFYISSLSQLGPPASPALETLSEGWPGNDQSKYFVSSNKLFHCYC